MTAQPQPIGLRLSGGRGPVAGEPADRHDGLEGAVLGTPVLIVEDEVMIAWMMESLLEEIGFTSIAIAATGEDAITQAERVRPG